MAGRITILLFLLLSAICASGQQTFTLSGVVTDTVGLPVENTVIHLGEATGIVLSGKDGTFFISGISAGNHHFCARNIGFSTFTDTIFFDKNVEGFSVVLHRKPLQLEAVTIMENPLERQRRQESATVSVVGSDYLTQNREGSLMKTLEKMPGISSIEIGSGESKPQIRGLGFNRVVVAENGIKHEGQQWGHDHGLEIDQFGVESVEVVKGPASLMYGSDAIGGVINIKQFSVPVDEGEAGQVTLLGRSNNNMLGINAGIKGRKSNKFYSVKLTGLTNGDYQVPTDTISYNSYNFILKNGFLKNTAGREMNVFAAGGFSWKKGVTTITVDNYFRKSGFYADAHGFEIRNSEIDFLASTRDIDLPCQQVNHFKIASFTTLFFKNHKLDITVGYQSNFRQEHAEPVQHGYMPKPDNTLEREFKKGIATANALMNHIFSDKHSLTAGINLEYQNNQRGGWGFLIPSFRRFTAGSFVYDKYLISKTVTLNAGVRFDFGTLATDSYHDWYMSPVFDENGNQAGMDYLERSAAMQKEFTNIAWSAGLSYSLKNWLLKLNVGKSFRMPDARELAANGVNYQFYRQELGDSSITSETAWQADLFAEYALPATTITFTPFFTWFPNYIYLNPTADFSPETGLQEYVFVQNEVIRTGMEFEIHQQFLVDFDLGAGLEYVYSEQLSGQKQGFGLPFSPPLTGTISLKWDKILNQGLVNDFFLLAEAVIAGRQDIIVPPEEPTPGYEVFHFSAGGNFTFWKKKINWILQLQNVFNTKYFNHTSYYRIIEMPEPGRNLQASITIPF